MMRLEFEVTYLDGRKVKVKSRPATEVAFERRFDRSITSLFAGLAEHAPEDRRAAAAALIAQLHSDYLYFLAWHSSKSDLGYDEWLELVDEIDWTVADTADPTPPAAPVGS